MKRALLVLLLAGCSSEMAITYHRVPLAKDRTLMVLVSKDKVLGDEDSVDLLDRFAALPGESLRANLGRIGDRSFAAIDSGAGPWVVTDAHVDARALALLEQLESEVQRRLMTETGDAKADLSEAQGILFRLGVKPSLPTKGSW